MTIRTELSRDYYPGSGKNIYIMNTDSSSQAKIINNDDYESSLCILSDGTIILFKQEITWKWVQIQGTPKGTCRKVVDQDD